MTPSSEPERRAGLARQLLSVGVLPTMVAIVIPTLLVHVYGTRVGWGPPWVSGAAIVFAGAAFFYGIVLVAWTVSLFGSVGEGTLAPWDPTRRLVVRGPYLRVRNPMITGVGLILAAEAAALGSPAIAAELGVFALANGLYIPLLEEPGLLERFGEQYEGYMEAVPRWLPRRRPWTPPT